MRYIGLLGTVFIAIGLLGGCGEQNSKELESPALGEDSMTAEPIVGGYATAEVNESTVIGAAEFAVAEHSKTGPMLKLLKITKAQTQVVAGINYKLELTVEEAGESKLAEVIVYQDLTQTQALSAWVWK